jgi:CheY-like chemotaxis protein
MDTGRKSRLLVIDDEPGVCMAIAFLLQDHYAVDTARDAGEAARRMGDGYAVVLLDVNLPDTNGFELLGRFRADAPETPVVLLSASCDAHMHERAVRHGAHGLIEKPFTRQELLTGLGAAMVGRLPPVPGERPADMV